jgi:hypothetical protein
MADAMADYEHWLDAVRAALDSINMPMADWQGLWPFDFHAEYDEGRSLTMPQ